MELRISAGKYKNKKLKVTRETKPVMEKVKNAIFSILIDKIENASVLDLFAGSGNLGLEALSRGALNCVFVEESYFATKAIEENILNVVTDDDKNTRSNEPKCQVETSDAVKFIFNDHRTYDIVFLDPPYGTPVKHIMKNIDTVLKKDALILYLHDNKTMLESLELPLKVVESRKYGKTIVDIIKYDI